MFGHDRDEDFLRATMGAVDLVYTLARRMVDRPEDAQDLVQETYLAALRAWRDRRRPRKVEPWLATICMNLGRSRFRASARRPTEVPFERIDRADPAQDPEELALAAVERGELVAAMWRLPEGQRVALTLVDLGGFTTAEAARAMGTPRGTVLSRVHRGRRALAVELSRARGQAREGRTR